VKPKNSDSEISEPDLIKALQQLGESGQLTAGIRQILSVLDRSRINLCNSEYWDTFCAGLSPMEQRHLFMGLVIAERELILSAGSVSPTSKVFQRLSDSLPLVDAYDLAKWSAETSPNHYTPISSMNAHSILHSFRDHMLNSGFRNFSQAYSSAAAKFGREKSAADQRTQEEALRATDERRLQTALTNKQKQTRRDERSDERMSQIEAAERLRPSERLRWLASTKLPLPSIPFALFENIGIDDIDIPTDVCDQLISKIDASKRPWKKLYDLLESRRDSLQSEIRLSPEKWA